MERQWDWRKASGGWWHHNDPHNRLFHAYDINNNSACQESLGLFGSCEEPNEGSSLCGDCIEVVKALPAGRDKKIYPAA